MTEARIQALLDARASPRELEAAIAALPPQERARARNLVAVCVRAAGQARPAPSPEFTRRALDRVAQAHRPQPPLLARIAASRLVAPFTSPASGFAAVAATAFLAVAVARYPVAVPARPGAAGAPGSDRVVAQLAISAPSARTVQVAGDFNGWRPEATPLVRGADGLWRAEIPVAPGRHYQYQFVVDGAWMTDPAARATVSDGFGGVNAILEI